MKIQMLKESLDKSYTVNLSINNLGNVDTNAYPYVVVRAVDNSLWYMSAWDSEEKAEKGIQKSEDFIVHII